MKLFCFVRQLLFVLNRCDEISGSKFHVYKVGFKELLDMRVPFWDEMQYLGTKGSKVSWLFKIYYKYNGFYKVFF